MRASARQVVAALVAAALAVTGCSGDDEGPEPGDEATTTSVAAESTTTEALAEGTLGSIELTATEVAELAEPVALAARPSSPDLYVAERSGRVRLVTVTPPTTPTGQPKYQVQSTPVLDLSRDVLTEGSEQGLLGITFSSDGRLLYVDYTAKPDGRTIVAEYELGDRNAVATSSRRELLTVEQPAQNHNGGQRALGPDGYLYIGLGDGGGSGDPEGRAQSTDELLGKILRIDPLGADGEREYGIPAGNPFAAGGGAPEIWLLGVRNPWRFSFDTATGDLWIGDVGQDQWEEIDRLPATDGFDAGRGANLGWDQMEGTHPFDGKNPTGGVLPLHEYSHEDGGCSVTGGYVYRGDAIEPLRGAYLYADFCAAGLRGLQTDQGVVIDERTWDLPLENITAFGQDNGGELFALLGSGPLMKISLAK
jgi:glucose/arabinose dehydrogenase